MNQSTHEHRYNVYVEDYKKDLEISFGGVITQISWGHYECACGAVKPPPPPPIQGCITKGEWLWNEIYELCDFAEGSNPDEEAIICLLNEHL